MAIGLWRQMLKSQLQTDGVMRSWKCTREPLTNITKQKEKERNLVTPAV